MKQAAIVLLPLALLAFAAPLAAQEQREPGPVERDVFHPGHQAGEDGERPAMPEPAWGGRVIIHLSSMPQHLQRNTENSAVVTWMHDVVHDKLAYQDWEGWHMEPRLATSWDTEDTLVLNEGAAGSYGAAAVSMGEGDRARTIIFGAVTDAGDSYQINAMSPGNPAGKALAVKKADVSSLEKGTVFTFHLRDDVKWHDGHPFDAADAVFSWAVYQNPEVDCDETRTYYSKILHAEAVDPATARFFYEKQYFLAEQTVCEIPLLARHIYDLLDPDCPQHDPEATLAQRGEQVNNNEKNNNWVGLGPYQVTEYDPSQYIDTERFDDYYDADNPKYGGYFDRIRFRYISDDSAAFQALLNEELDYFARVKSEQYFGEQTAQSAFTESFYKGYFYTGTYGYTGWNMLRPQLKEKAVRHALAHAFDLKDWLRTKYKGLAKITTGPQNYFSLGYDKDVEMLAYDPDLAEELLAEAGWYDRDGDGVADKDGIALEIEFLYPSGNDASKDFGIAYQEALAEIGIKLKLRNMEWATFLERILDREFDAINLAWVPPLESDPEQLWGAKYGKPGVRSSNHSGVMDEKVDEIIARGQRELDVNKRAEIWRELHRYIYDLQPYLFMMNTPRKFALNKNIRGLQTFQIAPGYDPRRWYYPAGTSGTRSTRARQ